jgi:H/ACA ribonucleoprotein complex subunit 4
MASWTYVTLQLRLLDLSRANSIVQKYGRANEATPAAWKENYTDFTAPLTVEGFDAPKTETPAAKTESEDVEMTTPAKPAAEAPAPDSDKKKRKRTDEEKAERKKKKEEKKAKKEKKSKKEEASDSE